MNFIILIVILFAGSFSCKGSEPKISTCPLVPGVSAEAEPFFHCYLPDGSEKDVSLKEALRVGYLAVSLDDFAEGKSHHEDLHIEIDLCD